jgi:hypothetical protein
MKIKLSKEIVELVKSGKCKAFEIVGFLMDNGFTSKKDAHMTSLGELKIDNRSVKSVSVDTAGYDLLVTLN